MLASITPLGERGRGSTWAVTVTAFALGSSLAGAAAGGALGALGAMLTGGGQGAGVRLLFVAGALGAAAVLDAFAAPAPGPRRQVNERWLDEYRGWVYGFGFGAQLGFGLSTVITSAATYAAFVAALLSARPWAGALIVGSYGAIRGLTPMLTAGVRTPAALMRLHAVMLRWSGPSRWLAVVLLAAAALAGAVGWAA